MASRGVLVIETPPSTHTPQKEEANGPPPSPAKPFPYSYDYTFVAI